MTDNHQDAPAPTLHGACKCGAMHFEVELDLAKGTTQCNCTFCRKNGWWGTIVSPDKFRLTQGKDPTGAEADAWVRCPACQTLVCGRGDVAELGGPFVSVNVRALDDVSLDGVPIVYLDGASNTWEVKGQAIYTSPFGG